MKMINLLHGMCRKFRTALQIALFVCTVNAVKGQISVPAGSYLINMGVTPQTVGNGLKPYGLMYDIIKNYRKQVFWYINPTKTKDGVDLVHNGVSYKGGVFIIPAFLIDDIIEDRISYWNTQGVVGNYSVADFTIPESDVNKIRSAPKWTLDEKNGDIAQRYLNRAGIPSKAYGGTSSSGWKTPAQLNCCDDLFVMPHADPKWPTHSNLYFWNETCRGSIWAACHAASALENMVNPSNRTVQSNFLSIKDPAFAGTSGDYASSNSLILWTAHNDGSDSYSNRLHGDPAAQYLGSLFAATNNGSEQIYIPRQGIAANASTYSASAISRWNPGAKVIEYDPTQSNVTNPDLATFKNVAAVLVYGRAFDDPNRGYIMYVGGHEHDKDDEESNIAAQRSLFNLSFLSVSDKSVAPGLGLIPEIYTSGNGNELSYTLPAGVNPNDYISEWSCDCGGSFLPNATSNNVTFIPPAVSGPTPCVIGVSISDLCGRTATEYKVVLFDANPSWTINKKSTKIPNTYSEVGEVITYDIELENTGDVTISNITVSDPQASSGPTYDRGDINEDGILDMDEVWIYTADYSVTQEDIDNGSFTNTATAEGTPAGGVLDPVEDDETVDALEKPAIRLDKDIISLNNYSKVGDLLTYTYTITNIGNVTLPGPFSITDDKIPGIPLSEDGEMPPGSYVIVEVDYEVTAEDLENGQVVNIAFASTTYKGGDVLSNEDTETAYVDAADLSLEKDVSNSTPEVGEKVTYTITILNEGPNPGTGVSVADIIPNGLVVDVASISDGGVYDGASRTITWTGLGVIVPQELTYEATVQVPGVTISYENYAEIKLSDQFDPNSTPGNNSDDEDDDDTEIVVPRLADLFTTKQQIMPLPPLPLPEEFGVDDLTTVDPSTAVSGTKIYYLITFGNNGPDDSKDVTLSEVFPPQITGIEYSFNFGNSWIPWAGSFNYGLFEVNTVGTPVIFRGNLPGDFSGTITNTVSISSEGTYDPDLTNNDDEEETLIVDEADLQLNKRELEFPVTIGGPIEYEIEIRNLGPSSARNVLITDVIDSDIISSTSYSTDRMNWTTSWPGSQNIGTLAKDGVYKLYIRGTVIDKTPEPNVDPIPNTAIVSSSTPDPNPDNNQETINTPLNELADLSILKTGHGTICAGEVIEYTISVKNNSNTFSASGVHIVDVFDGSIFEDVTYYDIADDTWKPWDENTNQYDLPEDLAPMEEFTLLMRAEVRSSYSGSNVANIAHVETADVPDPDLSDNSSSWTTEVQQCADMEIEKTLITLPAQVIAGETIEYLITYRNNGPSDARNVVVTDLLPSQILPPYEAALCGTGLYQPWNGSRNLGTVLSGGECVINIRGTVSPDFNGILTNQACVTTTAIDDNDENNCDDIGTQVYKPSIQIVKTADKTVKVRAGEVVTYTYVVTNTGNATFSSVTVTDDHSGLGTLGAITPSVVNNLAPGASATFTSTYTVTAEDTYTADFLYNTATVKGDYQGREYEDTDDEEVELEPSYDIGDSVWEDMNGNGRQDAGEPGIAGLEVHLYKSNGEYVATRVSNNLGKYLFQNVEPGDYYLEYKIPAGYLVTFPKRNNDDTKDSDITNGNGPNTTSTFTVLASNLNIDAGLYKCVKIGDLVWYDINKNDVWDTNENGINQIMVKLWRFHFGQWIMWSMTNTGVKPGSPSDDGYFEFCAPPGQYYVEVVMPPQGLVRARPNIGNNEEIDSDLTNANGKSTTDTFILTSGQSKTDIGAGFYPMSVAGNLVWVDENLNGIQEAGEARMEGVLVEAYNATTNEKMNEAYTDENGIYLLDYIEKGEVYLKFSPPSGYGATYPAMAGDGVDSDVDHTYGPYTTRKFTFQPGMTNNNIDMGLAFGILPVEWVDVYAYKKDRTHVISWKTANESNVSHYEIEKRIGDGRTLVLSQKINPLSNAVEIKTYSLSDEDTEESGVYYYRVRQVDFDGRFTYSKWVSLKPEGADGCIIYPNPASDIIKVQFDLLQESELGIELLDASLKVIRVITKNESSEEGTRIYSIDMEQMPTGIYHVRYYINGVSGIKKVIKIK